MWFQHQRVQVPPLSLKKGKMEIIEYDGERWVNLSGITEAFDEIIKLIDPKKTYNTKVLLKNIQQAFVNDISGAKLNRRRIERL